MRAAFCLYFYLICSTGMCATWRDTVGSKGQKEGTGKTCPNDGQTKLKTGDLKSGKKTGFQEKRRIEEILLRQANRRE